MNINSFFYILLVYFLINGQCLANDGNVLLINPYLQLSEGEGGVSWMVTAYGNYLSINQIIAITFPICVQIQPYLIFIIRSAIFIKMQQASQTSVKMEAHKDKSTNQVASSTKQRFFQQEITFLNDFKEQLEVLNQLAKTNSNPALQISKISKKIEKQLVGNLKEEILFTRREISLEEINDDSHFQTKVAEVYQERIEHSSHQLEHMESIVQQSEERRKSKEKADFSSSSYSLKASETRKTVDQFIKQKQKIRKMLKEKLIITGSIIKLLENSPHQLIKSHQKQHKYGEYQFLTTHQTLFRNKSRDRGLLEPGNSLFKSQKRQFLRHPLRKTALQVFQKEIFEQQLEKIRTHNNKLQLQISLLKQAVSQRQDQRLLQQLNQRKSLEREQMIAREMFAFQRMSRRFQQKLQKCSYRWVFQSKKVEMKVKSKEQDWEMQRRLVNRSNRVMRRRLKSADRKVMEQTVPFSPAEVNKSNIKTNCSLQAVQN